MRTTEEAVARLYGESLRSGTHLVVEWAAANIDAARALLPTALAGECVVAAELRVLLSAMLEPGRALEDAETYAVECSVAERALDAFDATLAALPVDGALRLALQTVLGLAPLPPVALDALALTPSSLGSSHHEEPPGDCVRRPPRPRPSVSVVDVCPAAAAKPPAGRRVRSVPQGHTHRPPVPGVVLETPPRAVPSAAASPVRRVTRLSLL